jgi:UDP-N-acetylmuramoyl-L-alanyl-D-glutamate--2,6-diaminopimelate ligase
MAQYAKAKSILAQWPHLKYAIINADDPELKLMFNTEAKAISFGMSSNDLHLSFENVLHLQEGMSASLCVYQDFGPKPVALKEALRFEFKTPLKGAYNLYNFLAVAAILRCRSISWSRIVEALSKPISIPGRLEEVLTERKDVPKCFVDFAHTPDALEAVLENMHQWKKTAGLQGRLVCVFGCGGGRDATKRTSMMEAALKWSDLVVVTADNPRNEALDNIMSDIFSADSLKKDPSLLNTKTMREDDRTKAIHAALSLLGAEDVCLIAGKGHETYQIIGSETYPYSDVTVVQEYFQDQ